MKRNPNSRRLMLLSLVLTGAGVQYASATPPGGTNWGLNFADEFNGTTLDDMKWINSYPWNNTTAHATAANVTVGNGVLNLGQTRASDSSFTGSAVTSRLKDSAPSIDKFNFTDGYIEASMRMPTHAGSWPAFWLLQGGWPPEIDIMEDPIFTKSSSDYGTHGYNTSFHYTNASGAAASAGPYVNTTATASGFHTWGLLWTPTSLTFYLDGQVKGSASGLSAAQIQQAKNMYILFTNGDGSWSGTPDQTEWPNGVSDQMQVDWVRVWKDTSSGYAASTTWTRAANGTWDTAGNWSTGTVPALNTQTATFGTVAKSDVTVDWTYSHTVGGLTFSSSTNYTLGAGNDDSLMLANPSGTAIIDATTASGSSANVINSRLELYNNLTIRSSGKPLTVNGAIIGTGALRVESGLVTLSGASTYTGSTTIAGGTLKLASTGSISSSLVDVAGGTFDVSAKAGYSLPIGAILQGNGSVVGSMTVLGTVQPGDGRGTLNTGDITFSSGSLLLIELAGKAGGTSYDVLNSSGSVNLLAGSDLRISLAAGFIPQVGDNFGIMNFASLSGSFSTVDLPVLPNGLSWDLGSLYLNGSIAIVPEPASLALLVPLALVLRRKR